MDYIRGRIAVALAGAVAEELIFGNRSTGAANDFKQAADMAKQIIFGGMSDLGIVSPDDVPKSLLHNTLSSILREVEAGVRGIIADQQLVLEKVVALLLVQESLSGDELRAMIKPVRIEECA